MTIAEQERARNIMKLKQEVAIEIIEMMKNKDGLFIFANDLELAERIAKKYHLKWY